MDDKRLFDHFALIDVENTGSIERDELLPTTSSPIADTFIQLSSKTHDITPKHQQLIVDLVIIYRTHGENPPVAYEAIWATPNHFSANLNHSGLHNHEMYLCIRRGRDKPPITDIDVLLEAREETMDNFSVIETTPHGYPASICNSFFSKERTLITYRRAALTILCNTLTVTDVCVIIESKGKTSPHSFIKINKNLNHSMFNPKIYFCYKKSVMNSIRIQYRPRIVSRYFDICEPSADVICVDLDSDIITGGTKEQKHWSVKIFPKKANEIKFQVLNTYQQRLYELPTHLKRNHNDSELHLQIVQLERNMETRIRDIFLRFMCTCFYGYKRFLRQILRQPNQLSTDICFRDIIQLCGIYDDPLLAVKIYSFMKKNGTECNAITYGAYNNRENKLNQDDMLSSIFSTLAGSIKDITESSFFPRMLLKKSPSMDGLTDNKIVPTTNSNNNNINNIAVLETAKKRSLSNTYDIHSKLDYSTLQSITHETARSDAGILMTTIDIKIVDIEGKEEGISSLSYISTLLTRLRAKFNQSNFSALYNSKNLTTIKSFALDFFTDLKSSVKSTINSLTQSKSPHIINNPIINKEQTLSRNNSNSKLHDSISSFISHQSSNSSSSLNTNNINEVDIKDFCLDFSNVAIPISYNHDRNSHFPSRIIEISSCSRCLSCNQFLYDQEIMNGWSADDSELHTICVHCRMKTIPTLAMNIRIKQIQLIT
ncbi:unnamed protein product [Rotaria sp. Silwood1]|nr:unnamed protein product [Rotaria sp. Silwood1]CAF1395482.1 unnamed protein product [Rotaria sp. Silwood1]